MEESMTSRSIGMDAIFQYTGSGVQLFSGAIFYIIIVRLFSTSSVGAIALFLAIVGLFNVIFSFGLGTAAQHFTSYNLCIGNYASVKKTIYKIIFLGFILSIAGFLSLLTVSAIENSEENVSQQNDAQQPYKNSIFCSMKEYQRQVGANSEE